MSSKFNYDGYTVTTEFTDDFSFSMTISDNVTGEFYANDKVKLAQIKKDTVIATLTRKNEKALKCNYPIIQASSLWLMSNPRNSWFLLW